MAFGFPSFGGAESQPKPKKEQAPSSETDWKFFRQETESEIDLELTSELAGLNKFDRLARLEIEYAKRHPEDPYLPGNRN